ncbi:hypothetical protein D1814_01360 [Alteromonas sp. BL110]|uniref:hypothetical protein n=1 Tax=Alteromonas sp. BL110 TaxID=1714845 RepID=UPI000E51A218|nr:hypothetical protein [Alteromonas sp. BL110]AXT37416.1 hypothetical protein D1814_01360 [Alteromonas sp. BL110]RKM80153.1 hypothetical protein D7031_14705 [Alteromonas sp. BL110]
MDKLTKEAYSVLSEADGFSQFFDRDAKETFAAAVMAIIDEFVVNGDVNPTSLRLEQVRNEHLLSNSH